VGHLSHPGSLTFKATFKSQEQYILRIPAAPPFKGPKRPTVVIKPNTLPAHLPSISFFFCYLPPPHPPNPPSLFLGFSPYTRGTNISTTSLYSPSVPPYLLLFSLQISSCLQYLFIVSSTFLPLLPPPPANLIVSPALIYHPTHFFLIHFTPSSSTLPLPQSPSSKLFLISRFSRPTII